MADRDSLAGSGPAGPRSPDQVALHLPADPEYGAIARTAAMALGLRAGFTWTTLTALAVAVDESLILLLADQQPAPEPGTVAMGATVDDGYLELTVGLTGARGVPTPEAIERFGALVDDAVDHWVIDPEQHQIRLVVEPTASGEPPVSS